MQDSGALRTKYAVERRHDHIVLSRQTGDMVVRNVFPLKGDTPEKLSQLRHEVAQMVWQRVTEEDGH